MSNEEIERARIELQQTLATLKEVWATRAMQEASREPSGEEIQAGIDAAMREVVGRDARHNPNALNAPVAVKVANAPVVKTWGEGRGFIEDKPYGPVVQPGSLEDRVMSALIDQALPPGGEKKDRK